MGVVAMRVLNSSEAFREHYAKKACNAFEVTKATLGGCTMASGAAGTAAWAVGASAAQASVWSTFAGWPLVGSFAAGKAAAVGWAAGMAALGSATVLLPATLLGLGVAYGIYRHRNKKTLQKGSGIEELADAFARVAFLPMLALAVAACRSNPENEEPVRDYVVRTMGAWGYAEPYSRARFDEALGFSPEQINGQYGWAERQLASGSTEGIGATPAELPIGAIRGFAEEFSSQFKRCA